MKTLLAIIFITCINFAVLGQTGSDEGNRESGVFNRTSISILPVVLDSVAFAYPAFLKTAGVTSDMEIRYDRNGVSNGAAQQLQNAFSREYFNELSVDNLENSQKIISGLRKTDILNEVIRGASNPDSVAKRVARAQKSIVTSAVEQQKINTVSAEQLFAYLNNAFIGVVVVNDFKEEKDSLGSIAFLNARASYFIFKLTAPPLNTWKGEYPEAEQISVTMIAGKNNQPTGFSWGKKEAKEVSLDFKREYTASATTKKIFDLVLDLDAFSVRGVIQDVNDGIRFDLGKREGVYLDEGFKVFELREDDNKKVTSEYIGFGRVSEVADNIVKMDALSSMYEIIGSFEQGHIVKSYDRGTDVVISPYYCTLDIPKTTPFFSKFYNFASAHQMFGDDIKNAAGISLGFYGNSAKYTNVTQLFFGLNGGIALPKASANGEIAKLEVKKPVVFNVNFSMIKKYWFQRLALVLQLDLGIDGLSVSGKYLDEDWNVSYGTYGAGGKAGIQYAVNPDLNIGAGIEYRASFGAAYASGKYKDEQFESDTKVMDKEFKEYFKDVKFGGLRFGVSINYSIGIF